MLTPKERKLNDELVAEFTELRRIPYIGTTGDGFDAAIVNRIRRRLNIRAVTTPEEWRERYGQMFEFSFKETIKQLEFVLKPNGQQEWPDCLILLGHRGLPIEFKSCKEDHVVWNSALPQTDGVYIYNGNNAAVQTTFFLGQDQITEEEKGLLLSVRAKNKEQQEAVNVQLKALRSEWSFFARPMNNCRTPLLGHPHRQSREQRVLDFLESFRWGL